MPAMKNSLFCLLLSASAAFGQGFAPEIAADKMTVADGLAVKLFAAEPDIRQPIFVKCDDRGRVWVIQYLQYPNPAGLKRVKVDRFSRTEYDRIPEPPPHGPKGADRITICEDTTGDGRADKFQDFISDLNLCTGVEFGHGGVYVLQVPYLLFYPDRDGDDVPDGNPEVLLEGFGMEDSQSLANHLTWGPDGWLYGLNGSTTTCRIRGLEFQQGVWRYHPITKEFELFCEGGGNLFGLTFDAVGNLFYNSNGNLGYHAVQGGYFEKDFGKHGNLQNPYAYGWFRFVEHEGHTARPNTGGTIYLADTFPAQYRGALMCGDFLGHTCSWWSIAPDRTTIKMKLGGYLLDSHDAWFGATDMCLGPAGEMYVSDFFDKRTAHPDPDADWDTTNGRIFKIESATPPPKSPASLAAPFDLRKLTSSQLVDLLTHPNHWFRQRARVLLAERRDREMLKRLQNQSLQTDNADMALQSLWALHVSGGLTNELAEQLLRHPSEHVRSWTVRLLGDAKQVSPTLSQQLAELAKSDPSAVVRCQLAATAKRLPGPDALAIVNQLVQHDADDADPRIPWLVWWAVEDKAISDQPKVLTQFNTEATWQRPMARGTVRKLLRRYAAEGTADAYTACLQLLQGTPQSQLPSMLDALTQGLNERSATSKHELTAELKQYIEQHWLADRTSPIWLQLALLAQVAAAREQLVEVAINPSTDLSALATALGLLRQFAVAADADKLLPLISAERPDEIQQLSLGVVGRFDLPQIAQHLMAVYSTLPDASRNRAFEVLLSRPHSALALLQQVDAGALSPQALSVDQLRRIALHQDDALNELVRKHWGNIQQGTPEEKLATVRRFNNDLRAGSGDRDAGKLLYMQHCGVCHQLFGEGKHIGPDLTKANRGDLNALLVNVVDPSSVIRKEYLSYVAATTSGQVMVGVLAEQDAASITLLDAKNQRTRIPRDEIDELTESPVSLMPEGLLDPLTPQQRRDLFAFLQSNP
jgi:putative heme-binding domain-containing protein